MAGRRSTRLSRTPWRESRLRAGGYAIEMARASQGMPTEVNSAKTALLGFDLKKHRMAMGVNIAIDDPGPRSAMDLAQFVLQEWIPTWSCREPDLQWKEVPGQRVDGLPTQ